LLRSYINDRLKKGERYNIRYKAIGDISKLDEKLQDGIEKLIEETSENTGLTVTIALNYGSRDEILRAVRSVSEDVKEGKISVDEIDDSLFSLRLDTDGIPDPDLLIRTSGEERLSNFLLWQLAYTEFYFTDVLWPDFDVEELKKAIEYYQGKDRRFGGVK
ncbi:MAG: di-trans,poly-cis-decaprenylcistransferase, partial [Eubacterium sp.]|nr:di-trans,poly-cis-decaprenylcistransferase [Eubacterium sp.]